MKFVQLAADLREEGLKPFYLIEGEEAYFRDHAVSAVEKACGLANPSLNHVRYEGEALKKGLSSLMTELYTLPFLDEKRIVRVTEFYPTEKEWETLRPFAEAPCPTTVLMIVNTGAKKSELRRKKGVTFVDCAKETEETLSRWLFGMARRADLSLDGDAASLFVRYCDLDAARMSIEIKKLCLLLGEGGRITRETVEEHIAKDVEYKIYELTQAASRGDRSVFSVIAHDLMEKGMDESALLSSLVSHYRNLADIAGMRGTEAEVAAALGVKPYAVRKLRETASRLGADRARAMYLELYGLAAGMRSGKYTKSGALSCATAKIFFA